MVGVNVTDSPFSRTAPGQRLHTHTARQQCIANLLMCTCLQHGHTSMRVALYRKMLLLAMRPMRSARLPICSTLSSPAHLERKMYVEKERNCAMNEESGAV